MTPQSAFDDKEVLPALRNRSAALSIDSAYSRRKLNVRNRWSMKSATASRDQPARRV